MSPNMYLCMAQPQQSVPQAAAPEAPARSQGAAQVQEDPVTESMIARMMEMGFPRDQVCPCGSTCVPLSCIPV